MTSILKEKISTKVAWIGKTLQDQKQWLFELDTDTLAVFDQALNGIRAKNLKSPYFTKADFVIQDMSVLKQFDDFADELENGYGFFVLRGLTTTRYSEQDLQDIYYGIGLYLGTPVTQNPRGDLLGKVENIANQTKTSPRVYETNLYWPYHTDLSDVAGLICLRKAKSGGLSSLVSAASVYNKILEQYPEYLGYYYHPTPCDHLGDDRPTLTPIFSYYQNKLSCRYMRAYIELGHERMGIPLSQIQKEALDIFDRFIYDPDLRLDMMLEPGDIQFCNNYVIMHSRTGFEDFEAIEKHRKLLRLWLKMPNARTLAPDFPARNGIAALV